MTHRHCRMCGNWAEERPMEQPSVRKTFKYKLKPTPTQKQALAFVLRRCRELYNAALQERRDAWQKCGVSVTSASSERPIAGDQGGPARIPRHPLPGLAGRARPPRPSF